MIRLWLSRGTDIPIQEQLSAQFVLGILSRRLAPGERLPSVRGLARQLKLHANTVGAVYQDLADRGWVTARRGSGIFVRQGRIPEDDGSIETFVQSFVDEGLARGFSLSSLKSSFESLAVKSQQQRFLVMDPDSHLAHVLASEIGEVAGLVIPSTGLNDVASLVTSTTCLLVTEAFAPRVPKSFRTGRTGTPRIRTIRLKSMQDFLSGHQRPLTALLIAVVSCSESILRWAWTLLSALGFSADSVLLRNSGRKGWQEGLASCDIVASDVITASELSTIKSLIVFRIVSDEFAAEIRELVTDPKSSESDLGTSAEPGSRDAAE